MAGGIGRRQGYGVGAQVRAVEGRAAEGQGKGAVVGAAIVDVGRRQGGGTDGAQRQRNVPGQNRGGYVILLAQGVSGRGRAAIGIGGSDGVAARGHSCQVLGGGSVAPAVGERGRAVADRQAQGAVAAAGAGNGNGGRAQLQVAAAPYHHV